MKITLAQALPLRSSISSRIHELIQERDRVAFVEAEKGEAYEKPTRTVDAVTAELNEVRRDYRLLDVLVAQNNLIAKLEWDGSQITLVEALELAKQIRGEIKTIKYFGSKKKQERKSDRWGSSDAKVFEIAQFNPEDYRKKALKMEREANRLSNEIDRKNHLTEFEFPPADNYL